MAKLILRKAGSKEVSIQITSPVLSIGRTKENSLTIKGDRKVSRRHARIDFVDGFFYITDLGSANGTYLNDRLIKLRTRMKDGDKVTIGDTAVVFFSEGGIVTGSYHNEAELQPFNPATEPTVIDKTKVVPLKPGVAKKVAKTPETKAKQPPEQPDMQDSSTVNCPRCTTVIDTSNIPKGAKVGCPRCKNIFTV